jgi:hypothetical protein
VDDWLQNSIGQRKVVKQLQELKSIPEDAFDERSEQIAERITLLLGSLEGKGVETKGKALDELKAVARSHPRLLTALKPGGRLFPTIQNFIRSVAESPGAYDSGVIISRLASAQTMFRTMESCFWAGLEQHPDALKSHRTLLAVSRALLFTGAQTVPPELLFYMIGAFVDCREEFTDAKATTVLTAVATAAQKAPMAEGPRGDILARIRKLVDETVADPVGCEALCAVVQVLGRCGLPLDDARSATLQEALRMHAAFMSHTQLSIVVRGFSDCGTTLTPYTQSVVLDALEDTACMATPWNALRLMRSLGRSGFKPKRRIMMALYNSVMSSPTTLSINTLPGLLLSARQMGLRVGQALPDELLRMIARDAGALQPEGVSLMMGCLQPISVRLDADSEAALLRALMAMLPGFSTVRKVQAIEGLSVFRSTKLDEETLEVLLKELLDDMPSDANEVAHNLRLLAAIGHLFPEGADWSRIERRLAENLPNMSHGSLAMIATALCSEPRLISGAAWAGLIDTCVRAFDSIETNILLKIMCAASRWPSANHDTFMKAVSDLVTARSRSLLVWEAFRMLEALALLKVPSDDPVVTAVVAQARVTLPQLDPGRKGASSLLGAGVWGLAALDVEVDAAFMDTIVDALKRSNKVPRDEVRRLGWALAELNVPLGFFQTDAGSYLENPPPPFEGQ